MRDVNRRALADDVLTSGREAAYDWYSSARDAYLQRREAAVRNGAEPQEGPNDDLYEIDDDPPQQ